MASENEIEPRKSTPSFLVDAARLRLASSRAALSEAKTDWTSKTPGLVGAVGMVAVGVIFGGLGTSKASATNAVDFRSYNSPSCLVFYVVAKAG